jgi:uncharacterized membrane protein HdeD (DUF308 family)
MSNDPNVPFDNPLRQELQHLRESWGLLLILGCCLVLVGIAAMICSFIAALATALFFGTLLLVGGVMQLVNAITCKNWRGFLIYLLAGILFAVTGLIMMNHPLPAAAGLTLMLAAAFIVGGIVRIVGAAVEHFHGWPWVMINGFISLFLGIFIWRHFPETIFWALGLFIGIELIFNGMSWIMLAIGIRTAFSSKA